MDIQKQQESKTCPTGDCPQGLESIKKIGLTPSEKRAIFFRLKSHIFKQKRLIHNLPLF